MQRDQCISVTDLRQNTTNCLSWLDKHVKFIFIHNKPKAVLIDFDEWEALNKKPVEFWIVSSSSLTKNQLNKAKYALEADESEFDNI